MIPAAVCRDFLTQIGSPIPEPVCGGLSDSGVFRCASTHGVFCLRGWPVGYSEHKLQEIYVALRRAAEAGLTFIPRYCASADGKVFVKANDRVWELTTWLPGAADYRIAPSTAKLAAAVEALAAVHTVWANSAQTGQSPACMERCRILEALLSGTELSSWTAATRDSQERELVGQTSNWVKRLARACRSSLQSCINQNIRLHTCIRDVRCEHVLFDGHKQVTGIVDYGALRVDEPATDLARLLGTCEPFNVEQWLAGYNAYAEVSPNIHLHRVALLDKISCLLSAVQWARWLVLERRSFSLPESKLRARWQFFLDRLQNFDWDRILDKPSEL